MDLVYLGYVGSRGGDAVQMFELAAGMAARGARVRAIVPDIPHMHEFAAGYGERGVCVERSPLLRLGGRFQNPLDVIRLLRDARRGAPRLHIHTGDICLPRVTLMAMDLLGTSSEGMFATIHHAYPEAMKPDGMRARYWAGAAARRFQRVICPSQHGGRAQIAFGVPAHRVAVIHNGIDTARFAGGDPSVPRRLLGVSDDTPLVVFTSRLDRQKRPLDGLAAFARVAADFPDALLAFVGSGSLEPELRASARASGLAERVRFVGHQANVPDWLAAATVWLLPSEAENFSLSLLEALAAGCPIVATLCRGNDEALVPDQNALSAPVGDVDGLAAALRRALADAPLRARLGEAARRTAGEYTLERMVDRHVACYNGG